MVLVLHNLHPPSPNLNCYYDNSPRTTRHTTKNRPKIQFSLDTFIPILTKLNKGKAPGTQCDSLDIFYKLERLIHQHRNQLDSINPTNFTQFFQNIANAEIPSRIVQILQTTYLVALENDAEDKTKLRPLGIPSAIRRITAIAY